MPKRDRRMRRSSAGRWSSWFGRGARRRLWRGSSSRRPKPPGTWVAQAGRDAGERTDGLRTEEREEMRRLRGRNRPLYVAGLSSSDFRNRRTPSNAS